MLDHSSYWFFHLPNVVAMLFCCLFWLNPGSITCLRHVLKEGESLGEIAISREILFNYIEMRKPHDN